MLTHRPHLNLLLCVVVASLAGVLARPAGGATTPATCPQSTTTTHPDGLRHPRPSPAGPVSDATCVPPTIASFTATPNPVGYGGTVTLSWSASSPNPLTCKISSSAGGATGGSTGSWTSGPLTSQ